MEHYNFVYENPQKPQQIVYVNPQFQKLNCPNRYVYVNQNFVNPIHTNTVLINPNFKQTVHINPNFKPHVRPIGSNDEANRNINLKKLKIHVNPEILKLNKQTADKTQNCESVNRNNTKPIVSTRTKLIRANNNDLVKRKQFSPIHTKYKIIRTDQSDGKFTKNKYKIDKTVKKVVPQIHIIKSKYYLLNKNTSVIKKNVTRRKDNVNRSKLISINGTIYKKTPNVLHKADLSKITSRNDAKTKRGKVLIISGNIYKLKPGNHTLKLMSPKINLPTKIKLKKITLSQGKDKLKKCNVPCPIYRKFGKCRGNDRGTCFRVHNPNQISLCTRFLQGACLDDNCLLSHKVSAEKMPTCKYFLEGLCSRENCQYLHVKISSKAEICRDFLRGFCEKGKECVKRHQLLCPDFEKVGKCAKRRCPYPHGDAVRKHNLQVKVAKIVKRSVKIKSKVKLDVEIDKNVRYYVGENCIKQIPAEDDIVQESVGTRKRLGDLPSFIPLDDESA